jgi:hypothetical protein
MAAGGLHEIHLALGLAAGLGQQHIGEFHHRGFHRQEAEALVVATDRVEHAWNAIWSSGNSSSTPGMVRAGVRAMEVLGKTASAARLRAPERAA